MKNKAFDHSKYSEWIDPNKVKPYERNAKKHDEKQINNIATSIRRFGWQQDTVLTSDNVVIIGHGRRLAAIKLGCEMPYHRIDKTADELTEKDIRELRIADNQTNAETGFDQDVMAQEIEDLDFEDFDFDFGLDGLSGGGGSDYSITEDEPPEPPEVPVAKRGDIWQLGRHRLMCGDSTSREDVERLMEGQKADIVFTDPPYLLETEGGCKGELGKSLKKQGQEIEFISNFNPTEFLNVLPSVFNRNMNAYIFCNKELLPDYLNFAKDNKFSWNVLVWKKPNGIPIGDSHRPDIEYLVLYRKNAIWNNGTPANYSRCLEFSRVQKTDENGNHPTIKPVELIANELVISSNTGSIVVDFFGGSGSTLIACEQLNRTCYMMELDPHYCDVIVRRWENLTGEKAVLVNG